MRLYIDEAVPAYRVLIYDKLIQDLYVILIRNVCVSSIIPHDTVNTVGSPENIFFFEFWLLLIKMRWNETGRCQYFMVPLVEEGGPGILPAPGQQKAHKVTYTYINPISYGVRPIGQTLFFSWNNDHFLAKNVMGRWTCSNEFLKSISSHTVLIKFPFENF